MKRQLFTLLLVAIVACGCGHNQQTSAHQRTQKSNTTSAKKSVVKRYGYRVVAELPHATNAYTQGLQWHNDHLYEGTGGRGSSQLKRVVPATGQEVQSISLEARYFGEGITILGDRIWQLTWTSGKAFVYDLQTLRKVAEYDYQGEGWGLTTDGTWLYMSDGSHQIEVRDPKDFSVVRTIEVRMSGRNVRNLNELEWIEGEIWANVYLTDEIVRINPADGTVVGVIDLAGIQAPEDVKFNTDVLNGIAYDPERKEHYVTGKNWNKVYKIIVTEDGN